MPYKISDIELNDNIESAEAIKSVLSRHEFIIHELIDGIKEINPKFNPIGEISMYLGLTQDEEYELFQHLTHSRASVEAKVEWLTDWLKRKIFECPEEYIKKIVYTFTSIDNLDD